MSSDRRWPVAAAIATSRLHLEALRIEHAEEMASLLDDASLHTFIGGEPATLQQLRDRYSSQVVGHSPDGHQGWLNWVVRRRATGAAVGAVQATLHEDDEATVADLAWTIATPHHRQGFATEAATAMAEWLRKHGTRTFVAHVHPEHRASIGVARRLGLHASEILVDGETRWMS